MEMCIRDRVIEKDKNRCEFLSEELTDATIINGDGTDRSLLFVNLRAKVRIIIRN